MKTDSIRGSELLKIDPWRLHRQYGHKIIHQSWKTAYIPEKHVKYHRTWHALHPTALCVLWTDDDNYALVDTFYPQFASTLRDMPLKIQHCDLIRLLYLHRYGGLYVDLDYSAQRNVFDSLPSEEVAVYIVRSPVLLNEVCQNSFMLSRAPGEQFWLDVADNINEIGKFIKEGAGACKKLVNGSCYLLDVFNSRLTSKIAHTAWTQFISGSAVLDKTLAQYLTMDSKSKSKSTFSINVLPTEAYFNGVYNMHKGGVCTHHQENTWVELNPITAVPELSVLMILAILCIVCSAILITIFAKQRECNERVHSICSSLHPSSREQ